MAGKKAALELSVLANTRKAQRAIMDMTRDLERLGLTANAAGKRVDSWATRLHAAGERMKKVGANMASAGRTMTRNVTLPVLAAGAASIKMAVDFDQAFTKIDAVSNASQQQIAKWRKSVLSLSGKTARSPQELAEALYFLSSAGLDASQILPTLEMSAKAAASGLGNTADIARLTANALNAYAKEGLTAAQVTDTLVAAVREGTADPDEFASALGRILPAAQKAGIGFDEVTASLAALSNIGLDVDEGVTAMRGVILALLAPTQQAADTLKDLGLTANEVRDTMANDGIVAVMRLLEEATGGNIDKLKKAIPNVRALAGLFGITGQKAEKVDKAFRNVANSTGAMDEAFDATKKGSAFRFERLMARLRTLAIKLGTILLPIAEKIAAKVGEMAESFSRLPKPVQENIIKWAALAAVLGPVLRLLGGIVKISGSVVSAISRMGGAAAANAGGGVAGMAGRGAAGAGAGAAGTGIAGGAATVLLSAYAWGIYEGEVNGAADRLNRELSVALSKSEQKFLSLSNKVRSTGATLTDYGLDAIEAAVKVGDLDRANKLLADALKQARGEQSKGKSMASEWAGAIESAAERATSGIGIYIDKINNIPDIKKTDLVVQTSQAYKDVRDFYAWLNTQPQTKQLLIDLGFTGRMGGASPSGASSTDSNALGNITGQRGVVGVNPRSSGNTFHIYADSVTDGKKLARFVREEWNRAEKEQARRHRGMPQPVTA